MPRCLALRHEGGLQLLLVQVPLFVDLLLLFLLLSESLLAPSDIVHKLLDRLHKVALANAAARFHPTGSRMSALRTCCCHHLEGRENSRVRVLRLPLWAVRLLRVARVVRVVLPACVAGVSVPALSIGVPFGLLVHGRLLEFLIPLDRVVRGKEADVTLGRLCPAGPALPDSPSNLGPLSALCPMPVR